MLRGYRDEFQIAGAKNATQQIRNRPGASFAKNVFISWRGPTAKDKRGNALYYIEQRPLTVEADTW